MRGGEGEQRGGEERGRRGMEGREGEGYFLYGTVTSHVVSYEDLRLKRR